jgi:hypothetical protein
MLSSVKVHSPRDYLGRALPKKPTMALQQEHSPTRPLDSPKTKVDRYEDPSQVALSEDPNSIMFTKDSSQLVPLTLQYCVYTYSCQAQQRQQDVEHQMRGSCLAQQPQQGGRREYTHGGPRPLQASQHAGP